MVLYVLYTAIRISYSDVKAIPKTKERSLISVTVASEKGGAVEVPMRAQIFTRSAVFFMRC
jgi:hypothetical protein